MLDTGFHALVVFVGLSSYFFDWLIFIYAAVIIEFNTGLARSSHVPHELVTRKRKGENENLMWTFRGAEITGVCRFSAQRSKTKVAGRLKALENCAYAASVFASRLMLTRRRSWLDNVKVVLQLAFKISKCLVDGRMITLASAF